MSPNAQSALYYLISTVFDLVMWLWIVRVILQLVRADFYNPFSQMVWKLTQPLLQPLQSVLPRWRNIDFAACLVVLALSLAFVYTVAWFVGRPPQLQLDLALELALLKILVMVLDLYTFTVIVQAILSWVGPGVANPVGSLLWSINEPLLRPVRRVIPPISGLDFSPLVVMILLQTFSRLIPLDVFR